MRLTVLAIALGLALGACGFETDTPDFVPTTEVGFARQTSLADEKSFDHQVLVTLSEASIDPVTVKFAIEGGTATPIDDFDLISGETLTFPPGVTGINLEIKVKADTIEEDNETIDLQLVQATNAGIMPGKSRHEVVINAKALPRVGFGVATTMLEEGMDQSLEVTLDMPSPEFDVTVPYTVTQMGATPDVDFQLADGLVTFPAGSTSQMINLHTIDDQLDEDTEKVFVQLGIATAAITDNTKNMHEHDILDVVDLPPTVQFMAPTSTFNEGDGTVNITVSLSAISGKNITVPYVLSPTATNSATGGGVDYMLTASPLMIPAGQMTGTIAVAITQDTTDEPNESFTIDMNTATNATNTGNQSHALTINDDDLICYGAANARVCFDSPPTGNLLVNGSVDTDGATCLATQPTGWTTTQDAACFIAAGSITVNGATTVFGSRPLVIVAATTLTVNANLDASSHQGGTTHGPGTPPATCAGTNPVSGNGAGGGGAGGSFLTIGGAGASGDNTASAGGTPAAAVTAPTKIRPGCAGQTGGTNTVGGTTGSPGGMYGGALYLVSGGNMTIANNITVNVSGAGGGPSNAKGGGGGGGSGGMLQIFVGGNTLTTGGNTALIANGGGGSGGGDNNSGGSAGQDPTAANYNQATPGGPGAGSNKGGTGFGLGNAATGGVAGNSNEGGGGGGGGGGYILSNKSFGTANVSAGVIVP